MICPHCGKETVISTHMCLLKIRGEEKFVVKTTNLLQSTSQTPRRVYNLVHRKSDYGVEQVKILYYEDKE